MSTLFASKEKLATVGAELEKVSAELMDKAANAAVPIEEVKELQDKKANLETRFNLIKEQHDKLEAEQKAALEAQRTKDTISTAKTDEARLIAAKAEFIRATIEQREMSSEAKNVLATSAEPPLMAIPGSGKTSTGQHLLPTTQGKELIHEPFVSNQLRGRIGMSAIKGLELPKIAYELDDGDDDFISDEDVANEIKLTGAKIEFGRNKFKVKVRISDTVLHGTDLDLVTYVENAMRSALAAKEKKEAFAEGQSVNMDSFYQEDGSDYLIEAVTGATLYEAITNALADLHEDFRENAQVCMRYADYVTMLKELSNQAVPLYGRQPEEIIGAPVFFCDAASVADGNGGKAGLPIIGDFRNYHINYDPDTIYDSDKDINSGDYIWALTAWFDCKFKLRSAFRLAEVVPAID